MAKKDILLRAGVTFSPRDVDARAIRTAVVRTLSSTRVQLNRITLGRDARNSLQESIRRLRIRVDSAQIGRAGQTALKANFRNIAFKIDNAQFSANAIRQLQAQLNNLTATVRPAAAPGAAAGAAVPQGAARDVQALQQQVGRLQSQLQATRGQLSQFSAGATQGAAATRNLGTAASSTNRGLVGFGNNIRKITTRFTAYLISLRLILGVQQAFNASLEVIFKFDSAIQDLSKVLTDLSVTIPKASQGILDLATSTGAAFDEISASVGTFVRAGLDIDAALERAEVAIRATQVSELSLAEATKLVTTSLQVFRDEITNANDALDIVSFTADSAATTADEVARAIIRSGAAAEAVGINFRQLNGIIAATQETTQQSASTIGAALKTIFARLAGNEAALREVAAGLGIFVEAGASVFDILKALSAESENFTRAQIAQLTALVGGVRRFTEFNAVLQSFEKAERLAADAADASGTAVAKQERELQKLENIVARTGAELTKFIVLLTGTGEGAEATTGIRATFADILTAINDSIGGINDLIGSLKESETAANLLSGVFSAIVKVGLFKFGPKIIVSIVQGLRNFVRETRSISTGLSQVATAQNNVNRAVISTNAARKKGTEELTKQNRQLRTAIDLLRISGRLQERGGFRGRFRFASDPGAFGGRGRAGRAGGGLGGLGAQIALVAALDSAAGQLGKFGDFLEAAGTGIDRSTKVLLNNLGQQAGSALSVATSFGLLLGPLEGATAGLIAFSASFIKGQVEANLAIRRFATAIEAEAARTVTFGEAIQRFGDLGEEVFRGLASEGQNLEDVIVAEVVFRERINEALQRQENSINTSVANLRGAFQRITRLFEEFDIREAGIQARRGEEQRLQQGIDRDALTLETAGVSREFQVILDLQLKSNQAIAEFTGSGVEARSEFEKIARLQSLIAARGDENVRTAEQDLQTNLLTTAALSRREAVLRDARAELAEAQAIEAQRIASAEKQTAEVNEQLKRVKELEKLGQEAVKGEKVRLDFLESTIDLLDGEVEITKDIAGQQKAIELITREREQLELRLQNLSKGVADAQSAVKQATDAIATAQQRVNSEQDKTVEKAQTALAIRELEAKAIEQLESRIRVNAAQTDLETESLNRQFRLRQSQVQAELRGGTIAERNAQRLNALQQNLKREAEEILEVRIRELGVLERRAQQLQETGQVDQAAAIRAQLPALEDAVQREADALERKAEIQFRLKLLEINKDNIERAESALLNFRLRQLDQIRQKEEEVSNRRIAAIERLSQTAAGREFIKDEIRPQPGLVREFGLVQAALVEEQVNASRQAVQGILTEFAELGTGGRFSAAQLVSEQERLVEVERELAAARRRGDQEAIASAEQEAEEVKASIKEMFDAGQQAFENLAKTQENIGKLLAIQEERNAVRREAALKNLESAGQRVTNAEKNLITERNKIPALNSKIIQAQKSLAAANAEVEQATKDLVQANQDLADAQFKLNFDIELAAVKARQSAGAFQSPADNIAALAAAFRNATSSIRASGEAILEARRAVLQEELSIVQSQLQSIKSLALEAATASPEDLAQLQNGLATAFEVAAGRADLSSLDPETLSGLSRFTDVVPGLEDALLQFGAERLGLDPGIFQTFESQLVDLSTSIAETGQSQVDAAEQQVAAAQAQLDEARQTRETAENNLNVALEAKDAQLATAGQAARQVAIARVGFADQKRLAERQLKQFAAGAIVDKDIKEAITAQKAIQESSLAQITELKEASAESLAKTETVAVNTQTTSDNTAAIIPLEQRVASATERTADNTQGLIEAINSINVRVNQVTAQTQNQATGTLTNGEINGLLAAAKREKRGMPAGANLMLANTSETVLTRKQAKKVGLAYKGHIPNAQEGFGVVSDISAISELNEKISNLQGAVSSLADSVSAQGPIQVQVESSRRIDVNGLQELPGAVQRAVEDQIGQTPSQEEVTVIKDSVTAILNRLRENGLEDFN